MRLADASLFESSAPETLSALEAVVASRALRTGETLFEEGDPGTFMFLLTSGRLAVDKRAEGGRTVRLRVMKPGDVGGLTSMTAEKHRSATLTALEDSEVDTVPRADFVRLLETRSDLNRSLIRALAAKVRAKTDWVSRLLPDSEARPAVAVFDAKPYEREAFGARQDPRVQLNFLEPKLSPATAGLAEGHAAVCAFVNDDLSAPVLRILSEVGVGLVALRCAGFNNVDMEEAKRLGLEVTRVPAYSPHAVAEHAIALVLALVRKVHRAHNRVRDGNFQLAGLVGFDLHGKTAGVVGLGKIGRCFARIARGFGMRVLAYDAYPDEAFAAAEGIEMVDLDALLAHADVVSLHAPLTPESHHLLDAARIARMKPGALLVNTSRGGLVDAQALVDALKSGQIGAAGLDVYEEESEWFFEDRSNQVITDDLLARLLGLNNVLVTSHQAFLTHEALDNIAETTLDNVGEWLQGRRGAELTNRVSPG